MKQLIIPIITVVLLYLAGFIAALTNGIGTGTAHRSHMITAKAMWTCTVYPVSIVDGKVIAHDLISISILVGGPLLSFLFARKGMNALAVSTALCSCVGWGLWVWFAMKMRALGAC